MPTYVVYAPPLAPETKSALAQAISKRHSAETGAPEYFAQVVFPASERYVGGARVESGHIWVRADIRSGRDAPVRSSLAMGLAKDISAITGVKLEAVWVYITNIDASDIVEYGRVMPNPGDEGPWLESMDHELIAKLKALPGKDVFEL